MGRQQINARLSDELVAAIDEKRVKLRDALGGIPSRSDVVRMALESYLDKVGNTPPGGRDDGPKGSAQSAE